MNRVNLKFRYKNKPYIIKAIFYEKDIEYYVIKIRNKLFNTSTIKIIPSSDVTIKA